MLPGMSTSIGVSSWVSIVAASAGIWIVETWVSRDPLHLFGPAGSTAGEGG